MKASLIITTYNWKEALSVVLDSIRQQSVLPGEVIIADDGSREDTQALIAAAASDFPVPLIHSWQPDDGFRAAESRNRAMAKAQFEYLIIIDGDMVLPQHFVAAHLRHAKPGQFIQGGRVLLNEACSQKVIASKKLPYWFASGLKNRHNTLQCPKLSRAFSRISNTDKSTRSCNMSFWRADILRINGFNNDFVGWGREDSEFVHRLLNLGLNRLYLKFSGAGYHLYHAENTRASLAKNDEILENTVRQKLTRCDNGIDKFMDENA
ncbi:glycosyltransferase family 2 protein [Photobacterium sp. GJ3]|uniref:glycosyltransferase family 2 protein n=1 Tax=Photobacterium sp. GJ3 TaxID=2829502 RepID=UPI001B8D2BA4|nr:glycosyltransferase family 2 protein [Photobacterium sp. GJ3]QUJ67290.1 glycosyltransferase family 2 protein [Photobacterium sp. GJ3]